MSDLLADRERLILREVVQLIQIRASVEQQLLQKYESGREAAERDRNKARKQLAARRDTEQSELSEQLAAARSTLAERLERKREELSAGYEGAVEKVAAGSEERRESVRSKWEDKRWTIHSQTEADVRQIDLEQERFVHHLNQLTEQVETLGRIAEGLLARFRLGDPAGRPPVAEAGQSPTRKGLDRLVGDIEAALDRHFTSAGFLTKALRAVGFGRGAAAGHLADAFARLEVARDWCRSLRDSSAREHDAARRRAQTAESEQYADAEAKYQPRLDQADAREHAEMARLSEALNQALDAAARERDTALRQAELETAAASRRKSAEVDALIASAESICDRKLAALQAEYDANWNAIATRWSDCMARLGVAIDDLLTAAESYFPDDWATVAAPDWHPPAEVPRGVRFGSLSVDWNALRPARPLDERLPLPEDGPLTLPAYLPFPDRCSLLVKGRDGVRAPAAQALQSLMLRFLTALPPGKVRFTIIDPVSLGDNFAAFMHLADYDEQIVGPRIWTEAHQIEQRLTDLTAHMETVIQKYLRNQYRSIVEYNAMAGEVAEPFRVLIVANFPAQFSPEAARRLASIVQTGGSCGVYTLVTADTRAPLPQGFDLSDIEQHSTVVEWKDDRFRWRDPDVGLFHLALETPPDNDTLTAIVRRIGERSRDANRVQVPFAFVAPKVADIWKSDSRTGVSVALGRAGATKRQVLALGKGTSQHVLVAGKTGSGKSTLLHALITSVAMSYSPDEVELYLIDFKKGVEFKAYAASGLPHARVVAIESEREFGLSVLQRLDGVLKERGDRFRALGVNDVAGFRAEQPQTPLPRILLVVDEFQEYFVAEDRISQEATLLLDRLVRQGRAFGLHVLLGSQTLGGAYTLARSTIDQMAIRIALQCSETDAQLILSKDNNAARLLSRPGEAIYNDAGGSSEANDLFQVVWLSDSERETILSDIRARADAVPAFADRLPLVFEGNTAADIGNNDRLERLIGADDWHVGRSGSATAWLGEAIAIKDPTAAAFRRQSGSNLLMLGQDEESARSILGASLAAVCLQQGPAARAFVLDASAPEDERHGELPKLVEALGPMADLVDRPRLAAVLAELSAEVQERLKSPLADVPPRYLVIHGLQRYRELRKPDDDYSFGRRGERTTSPGELFVSLLRDGPSVGVHVLMWCDSLTNLNRALDRASLRDVGQRVLFQMSAADSANLIDSPAASRLGRNRALFTHDELEHPEKFRPYGPPSPGWLGRLAGRLAARQGTAVGA